MIFQLDPLNILLIAIIIAISIWLHEYAHAFASHTLWDPTPSMQKRLSPNPLLHIDPIWFFAIFFIGFGRGKPVQVNPRYYKHPVRDELIVALSWPATNLLLSILWIILILVLWKYMLWINNPIAILGQWNMIIHFWTLFAFINIVLAVFNMLPFPPLDWFRLVQFFFPKMARTIMINPMFVMIGLLAALFLFRWVISSFTWWIFNNLYVFFSFMFF